MAAIFGIDLRSLALFRVWLGLTILFNLANLAPWATAFFSDHGVLPRASAIAYDAPALVSLYFAGGTPWFVALMLGIHGLLAFAFLIGYRARLVTPLLWLFSLSLINRNLLIVQGGDVLLSLLLFWAMFLPVSARFSIDAALDSGDSAAPPANQHFDIASAAILIQAAYVYGVGALLKTSDIWWPRGEAVYFALSLDSFATPAGHWLREQLGLTRGLTYFVWWLELLAPLLLFSPVLRLPLRLVTLGLLVAMHLGFLVFLNVGHFPLVSLASLLLFLPGAVWDRLFAGLHRQDRKLALYYDRDCGFCRTLCRLLRTFHLPGDTPILPAQDDVVAGPLLARNQSWVVIDEDGCCYLKSAALAQIWRRSPLSWPLGWLIERRGVAPLADRVYDAIGRNRMRLGPWSARYLAPRPLRLSLPPLHQAMVLVAMLLAAGWNVTGLDKVGYRMPAALRDLSHALRLDQRWDMFAPHPMLEEGYISVRGAFEDGAPIDLWTGVAGEPPLSPPVSLRQWFKDYRWRKYMQRLVDPKQQRWLADYARYLCRDHNVFHPRDARLATIHIDYHIARSQPPGMPKTRGYRSLLAWNCLG